MLIGGEKMDGATWSTPNGPKKEEACHPDHPVVDVSWNDERSYAKWTDGHLPTEGEWEHAARGGLGDVLFRWGNQEPDNIDFQPCNIWPSHFPERNTALETASVNCVGSGFVLSSQRRML